MRELGLLFLWENRADGLNVLLISLTLVFVAFVGAVRSLGCLMALSVVGSLVCLMALSVVGSSVIVSFLRVV